MVKIKEEVKLFQNEIIKFLIEQGKLPKEFEGSKITNVSFSQDFSPFSTSTRLPIKIEVENHISLDELKKENQDKCESCVHTYEEDNVDNLRKILDKEWIKVTDEPYIAKITTGETLLNSEETDKILKNAAIGMQKTVEDKIKEIDKEALSKSKESGDKVGKALSDVVSIFINITNPDNPDKLDAEKWAKKLSEALKNNRHSW